MKNENRKQEINTMTVLKKTYVQVTADFYPDGRLRPTKITWNDLAIILYDHIKEERSGYKRGFPTLFTTPGSAVCKDVCGCF